MKESRAWRVLAEDQDADKSGSWYLCNAIKHAETHQNGLKNTPYDLREKMVKRIESDIGHSGPAYDDTDMTLEEEQGSRVLACLMFAQQAADEEKEL